MTTPYLKYKLLWFNFSPFSVPAQQTYCKALAVTPQIATPQSAQVPEGVPALAVGGRGGRPSSGC